MPKIVTNIIEKLYKSVDGMRISLSERDRLHISNSDLTYGEINPTTFADMLALVQPQPGEVFYDLGSGAGKAVYSAAMLYDWSKCSGIELLPGLYMVSQKLLEGFNAMPEVKKNFPGKRFPIEFIQEDFLNADFSDADVIFLHATTFGPMIWDPLMVKLRDLKSGVRVIVNTKQLDSSYFDKMSEHIREMGWGESTVFTYKKK